MAAAACGNAGHIPAPPSPAAAQSGRNGGHSAQTLQQTPAFRFSFRDPAGCALQERPASAPIPTLAPIWLPHCPAWMCTISRMVPVSEAVPGLSPPPSPPALAARAAAPLAALKSGAALRPAGDVRREWRGRVRHGHCLPRPAPVRSCPGEAGCGLLCRLNAAALGRRGNFAFSRRGKGRNRIRHGLSWGEKENKTT